MIKRLFSPPVFDNEEDNFRAKFINAFAWSVIVLLTISLIPALGPNADRKCRAQQLFFSQA